MDISERTNSIFGCLSHPYRRITVNGVRERGSISIDEIAQEIVNQLDTIASEDIDVDRLDSIRIELQHLHLPKLAEADLIEYDRDTELISTTSTTTHLTALGQIAYSISEVM